MYLHRWLTGVGTFFDGASLEDEKNQELGLTDGSSRCSTTSCVLLYKIKSNTSIAWEGRVLDVKVHVCMVSVMVGVDGDGKSHQTRARKCQVNAVQENEAWCLL
jgi:hypothetical protein